MTTPIAALNDLLKTAGHAPAEVTFTGAEPQMPTNFLLTTAGAATIAACGVAAADLWHLKTGRRQQVKVEMRQAAVAVRSDRYLSIDGQPAPRDWDPIMGFYQTRDGRWVMIHANFPHHRDGALKVLGAANDRASVEKAVAKWDAHALEDACADAGLVVGIMRSRAEWEAHPHGAALTRVPVIEITKIADSPPEPLKPGPSPLSGVRVLDCTRVIAGPVGGRTLAEYGADVLHVRSPQLPSNGVLDVDTNHGKLSSFLDLSKLQDIVGLQGLVREADVFSQSYRPGTMAARGFSPEALAALRPGIIYVTLSAYGHQGPWSGRRGFDTLVQTTTGFVEEESRGGEPRHIPAQTMDYCSGYLMAFGAMVSLHRRATEGGSYLVRVALAQTGHWINALGRLPEGTKHAALPQREDIEDLLIETDSPFGRLTHVAPAVQLSETPTRWERPSVPFGTHPPAWP